MHIFYACLTLCLSAIFFLFTPDQAFAWGPGVHLVTGNWLLQNLAYLPAVVAESIMCNPGQFLHGILSADIFIGKGSKAKKGHSHNWESGFALLDQAMNSEQRSYAYGYLCHLAADTVAHNVFVPGLLHTLPVRGKAAHIFLEIQADALLQWDGRDALAPFREKNSPESLALLRQSMHRKRLPFWLNKNVYLGSIAIGGSALWRNSIRTLDKAFPRENECNEMESLLILSTRAMFDILSKGKDSQVLALDPIGAEALTAAGKHSKPTGLLGQLLTRHTESHLTRQLPPPAHARIPDAHSSPKVLSCGHFTVPNILCSLAPVCALKKELP